MKDLEAFMFGAYDESLLENTENISDKEMQEKDKAKEKKEAKKKKI